MTFAACSTTPSRSSVPAPSIYFQKISIKGTSSSQFLYENVNNGVYRAGFATSQAAYETACRSLFSALDNLDARLATRRYLFGNRVVEADLRLFCTLIRFDAVYHGHFKCNLRRIADYANLQGYLMDIYQQPGIAETVNLDHIKRHYYMTQREINPSGIVPIGPGFTSRGRITGNGYKQGILGVILFLQFRMNADEVE